MMRAMRWLLLPVLLAAASGATKARELTPQEATGLAAEVEDFGSAMESGDLETVSATIPPRVLDHIARSAGVDTDILRSIIIEQMEDVFAENPLEGFAMDAGNAIHRELADGAPYALVPTETDVEVDGRTMRMRSHTLALMDQGEWYLLRVSEAQQIAILRQVYPEFAEVEFPESTVEVLE